MPLTRAATAASVRVGPFRARCPLGAPLRGRTAGYACTLQAPHAFLSPCPHLVPFLKSNTHPLSVHIPSSFAPSVFIVPIGP
ncbi:MAG: hypothetical protein ACK4KT_07060 [Thermaurantimonas sp.]